MNCIFDTVEDKYFSPDTDIPASVTWTAFVKTREAMWVGYGSKCTVLVDRSYLVRREETGFLQSADRIDY